MSTDLSKEKFFFYDSLINIFKPEDEQLWAFSVYFGRGLDGISSGGCKAIYAEPELALRAAKLHSLKKFVARSRQLHWLTDYPSDRVLIQSGEMTDFFGNTRDFLIIDLYQEKQDRIDFLEKVALEGTVESPVRMLDLDGRLLDGVLTSQLVKLDADTAVLLEEFKPQPL